MSTTLRTLAFLIVTALAAASLAAADAPQKWALVVGVDAYQHAQIRPLQYAGSDAREVAKALREAAGFPSDNVIVMSTSEGEPPTAQNILGKLVGLRGLVGPNDTFVFFFSGHGVEKDGERWLLTSDANPASIELLRKSALGVGEVQGALKGVHAARVLQIVDACANDPFASGKDSAETLLTEGLSKDLVLSARRGGGDLQAAVTLFSCKVGQRSYESANKRQGYFTWHLVKGIRGEAAGADGAVTVPSLVSYLGRSVARDVQLNENRPQEPWATTDGTGAMDWVLSARKGTPPPAVAIAPPRPTIAPPRPNAAETVHDPDGTVLRYVSGGRFTMGSNALDDASPPHAVTLAPYWIGKTEVTNAQYRRFVKASGHRGAGDWERFARAWGDDAPVVCVSWQDAAAYCD